jgi:hypothetical protein
MFDKYNLVFWYFGMLSSDMGSTSHETPGSVSKKPKHDIMSIPKKTNTSDFDAAFLSEQKQLNNNMSTAAASMSWIRVHLSVAG